LPDVVINNSFASNTNMRTIDLIALVASAIVAIILATTTIRKSVFPLRAVPAFFMFFGPAVIFVHMVFHTGNISYNTFQGIQLGTFTYNFRFYSLMLMGLVLIYSSATLLQRIKNFLVGGSYASVLKAMLMIFVVSAPTIPFTPIGSLPVIACIITLVAMPFVRKIKGKIFHSNRFAVDKKSSAI
jgi:hypothetical protein